MRLPGRRRAVLALVILLGGVGALPVGTTTGAGKPTISDLRVASVSQTTATVTGSVNPNGLDTGYAGQYGPTGYGTEINPVDVGAGTSPVPITIQLNGLSPGSSYQVLLTAENRDGVTNAPALSLQTQGSPPTTTTTSNPPPKPPKNASRFVRVPVVGGLGGGEFSGVACAGSSLCVAAGSIGVEPTVRPLLERWGGHGWHELPSRGAGTARLLGVACPSAATCYAAGNSGAGTAIALRWSGRTWLRETPPIPAGSGFSGLNSVFWQAADDCWAVGYVHGATPDAAGLIEHRSGAAWKIVRVLGRETFLTGVDCPSRTDCWAVGTGHDNVTIAEHWNGHAWRAAWLPRTHATSPTVACPSRSSCWLGTDGGDGLLRLVGGRWRKVLLPLGAAVRSIACSSLSDCWAAGFSFVSGSHHDVFASHWDGRHWTTARTVNLGSDSFLVGIACPTPALCLAVGEGGSNTRIQPLAERLHR